MRFSALLAAIALTAGGAPARAQQAAASAAAQVDIAFTPPLETVLRFRVTRTKVRSDRPGDIKAAWIEELRFARSGDGFILYWRMDPTSLPPEMRHPLLAPMVAPFSGQPIAFDLDADGSPLRVRDWSTVLPKLLQAVDGVLPMAAAQTADKAQAERATAQVRAMFADLDAEQAKSILLKNVAPLLQWGGISMRVGETVAETNEQPVPILGGNVTQNVRVTLAALDPGKTARIEMRTETDRASFKQLIAHAAERFGAIADPAQKEKMTRELAQMERMEIVDSSVVVIDLATGLPRTLDTSRKARIEGITQSEDLRIEWLR